MNLDLTSLIEIVIVVVVIYFFFKFIVSPVIRVIFGIIVFIILISLLQRFFGFNLDQVLAPFGISLNSSSWGLNLNWLFTPLNHLIDQIQGFINFVWINFTKAVYKS